MLATGRSISLVSALAALTLFVIMETSVVSSYSAYVPAAQLKGKGDGEEVQEGFDGKRNGSDLEKPKLIRVPLRRVRYQDRDRRSIDTVDETMNEYERNGGYGRKSEGNADYYAWRQAVMEKYYARQQEIATKYADQGSTTTRPISRFDLLAEMDTNNVSSHALGVNSYGSSTTQAHKQIRDTRMNYRGIDLDAFYGKDALGNINEPGTGTTQDTDLGGAPGEKVVRGNCHIGTLLFQHNLNFEVYRSSSVETDIQVLIDESYCIACISMQPRYRIKSTLSIDTTNGSRGGRNTVKLTARGAGYKYYEQLQLDVQLFVVRKRRHRCDPI